MIKFENHCVDCGLPCLGNSCPYKNVKVVYCDMCGSDGAEYIIDGKDICAECAETLDVDFEDLVERGDE